MSESHSSQPSDPLLMKLSQLIASYPATHAIYVAAKLGIADLVAEVPKTADELADETKSPRPLAQSGTPDASKHRHFLRRCSWPISRNAAR
jgi:hypothetical protein